MIYNRRTYADLASIFERRANSLRDWLNTFSSGQKKRPDGNIMEKREDYEACLQAAEDYRRAAERVQKPEEQQRAESLATRNPSLPAQKENHMQLENRGYRVGGQAR
jgi:hypothetical protein